jgi:hypothetical protein
MSTLDSKLRKKLEDVVVEARDIAEAGARDALQALTVHEGKRGGHLSEAQAELRNRLRIHGRQLGDERRDNGEQAIELLIIECAYEHWHRMLFSRFLAANELLVEPKSGMAVSLEDVAELASDENVDPWELAASFATGMLPQIFRVDSPVLALSLPTEQRKKLEELLESLPNDAFTASDSLGWVYQFWQTKRKQEVNESEVKIGARELPAVTQLFTEPYMVSFLLDNSLGAWWAARRLTEEDLRTANSEQELRDKAALPGVSLEYLRFVRIPSGNEGECDENTGPWTPASGTYDAWPKSLSELKTLDPCCGSGHFLVAAFLMLVPIRMELEGLSAREAVDRVLSENIHGLEIDQRCVELAAFALALAAWKFYNAGGYRSLPDLNVACCGLSVSVAKEEWKQLAGDDNQLKIALDWMYDEFKNAPVLGSLLNPATSMAARVVKWDKLEPRLEEALLSDTESYREVAVVAHGLARMSQLLAKAFHCIFTNVPYLALRKENKSLAEFTTNQYPRSKQNLGVVFIERMLSQLADGGVSFYVSPQDWTFLDVYKHLRDHILRNHSLSFIAKLGIKAFTTPMWDMNIMLIGIGKDTPNSDWKFSGFDLSAYESAETKAENLKCSNVFDCSQFEQRNNPDQRIVFEKLSSGEKLGKYADALMGVSTGDGIRFHKCYWEVDATGREWEFIQGTVSDTVRHGGRSESIFWQEEKGEIYELAQSVRHLNHSAQNWQRGRDSWGRTGVVISQMGELPSTLYSGEIYDCNCCAIVPFNPEHCLPLWCYAESEQFHAHVRLINQALKVPPKTLLKIPFDLAHWQEVASCRYPYGLPKPFSDDPTQWIFHGHPASSTDALQVAVGRLLGYRWPAELDSEMELSTDARTWIERCDQLISLADDDGIVCIPAVASEQSADGRLLSLLHQAFEDGVAQELVFSEKIEVADENDPLTLDLLRRGWKPVLPNDFNSWFNRLLDTDGHKGKSLESWLRDKFFDSHCKRFNQTPFVLHIWDGHREGFSALVNYHKLAGSNGRRLLEKLTHSYIGDWINRQQDEAKRGAEGADARLIAARNLKAQLELILAGEPPFDIFVRWKPLHQQPVGWEPDINDGVRLNIRPFMAVDIPGGKKGAGILRVKPNTINWNKDRGKEVEKPIEDFPWFWDWDGTTQDFTGGDTFTGDRWNDLHYSNTFKQKARDYNSAKIAKAAK